MLFDEVVTGAVRANVATAEAIRDGAGPVPVELRQLTTRYEDQVIEVITAGQADGSLLNGLVADRS